MNVGDFCNAKIGKIALESELTTGDVVYDRNKKDIHTIFDEMYINDSQIEKVLTIHSAKNGWYRYEVPKYRNKNYSFIFGGVFTCWEHNK